MIISLISILTVNHIIGKNNSIPWNFLTDKLWFKYHTLNKPVIMGRKTFESMREKPLLNRLNIVLSRSWVNTNRCSVIIVKNVNQALSLIRGVREVMIIGGGEIYNLFLSQACRLYLTYISGVNFDGNIFFPLYEKSFWKTTFRVSVFNQRSNNFYCDLNFKILEKK